MRAARATAVKLTGRLRAGQGTAWFDDLSLVEALRRKDDEIDRIYSAIKRYLAQVSREALDANEARRWTEIIQFTINLEHIGDIIEAIAPQGRFALIDDPKMLDGTYDAFAPYWEMGLAVRAETVRAQLSYADEKEFPQAKNPDPRDFFDNSFVNNLARSGFFKQVGLEE